MIYELTTYDLQPNSVAEAERRFAEAYAERRKLSELAASFHTEIGPLNQVVQIWPYESFGQREELTARAARSGAWPPVLGGLLLGERSELFVPLAFSPPLAPGSLGPFFELRLYTLADESDLPKLIRGWEAALPARLERGPLAAAWRSEPAAAKKFLHLWPYPSLDERWRLRREIRAAGLWPPAVVAKRLGLPAWRVVRQENRILVPSAFSPLQ